MYKNVSHSIVYTSKKLETIYVQKSRVNHNTFIRGCTLQL